MKTKSVSAAHLRMIGFTQQTNPSFFKDKRGIVVYYSDSFTQWEWSLSTEASYITHAQVLTAHLNNMDAKHANTKKTTV